MPFIKIILHIFLNPIQTTNVLNNYVFFDKLIPKKEALSVKVGQQENAACFGHFLLYKPLLFIKD